MNYVVRRHISSDSICPLDELPPILSPFFHFVFMRDEPAWLFDRIQHVTRTPVLFEAFWQLVQSEVNGKVKNRSDNNNNDNGSTADRNCFSGRLSMIAGEQDRVTALALQLTHLK